MVRQAGFEPTTPAFGGQYSIHLSYWRIASNRETNVLGRRHDTECSGASPRNPILTTNPQKHLVPKRCPSFYRLFSWVNNWPVPIWCPKRAHAKGTIAWCWEQSE